MQEEILEIYKKILDYTIEIKAAIENESWEQVNLLASHREGLFQKSNAFVMGENDIDSELKEKINKILTEIKEVDDANFESINKSKDAMKKLRAKVNVGHRVLNAYHSARGFQRGSFDKST